MTEIYILIITLAIIAIIAMTYMLAYNRGHDTGYLKGRVDGIMEATGVGQKIRPPR